MGYFISLNIFREKIQILVSSKEKLILLKTNNKGAGEPVQSGRLLHFFAFRKL